MMKTNNNCKLVFGIFFLFCTSQFNLIGQSLSSEQTDRLFRMGQLWGHITYFHPYLQYQRIPFDSAYAEAIPKV